MSESHDWEVFHVFNVYRKNLTKQDSPELIGYKQVGKNFLTRKFQLHMGYEYLMGCEIVLLNII